MIERWSISRFKSVTNSVDLRFAPLTILAGTNSSGKSSVIQSILMVAQTISSSLPQLPVVLNGDLVKLGKFSDIKSTGTLENSICLGFQLRSEELTEEAVLDPKAYQRATAGSVCCEFEFGLDSVSDTASRQEFRPKLLTSEIKATDVPEGAGEAPYMTIRANTSSTFQVDLDRNSVDDVNSEAPGCEIQGAQVSHFLPSAIRVKVNPWQIYSDLLAEAITEPLRLLPRVPRSLRGFGRYPLRNQPIPNHIWLLLINELSKLEVSETNLTRVFGPEMMSGEAASMTIEEWRRRVRRLFGSQRDEFSKKLRSTLDTIANQIRSDGPNQVSETALSLPLPLENLVEQITDFPQRLYYLGPLRDEPRAVHAVSGFAGGTSVNVGLRGEYTAATLHFYRDDQINYIPSQNAFDPDPVQIPATLYDAVVDWLSYMDMLEDLSVEDRGSLGYELLVRTSERDTAHDLTQVGVGVSQLLPIVVLCLLAEEGATIILEQPELHLHPRTQALLADFLISISRSKQQCIVETHSEHLINRVRLRIAESENRSILDNTQVYFVEKQNGTSEFRPITINEFGAIQRWPRGFFDQSQLESQEILRASAVKRIGQTDR